jgi:hypothetical protein
VGNPGVSFLWCVEARKMLTDDFIGCTHHAAVLFAQYRDQRHVQVGNKNSH